MSSKMGNQHSLRPRVIPQVRACVYSIMFGLINLLLYMKMMVVRSSRRLKVTRPYFFKHNVKLSKKRKCSLVVVGVVIKDKCMYIQLKMTFTLLVLVFTFDDNKEKLNFHKTSKAAIVD